MAKKQKLLTGMIFLVIAIFTSIVGIFSASTQKIEGEISIGFIPYEARIETDAGVYKYYTTLAQAVADVNKNEEVESEVIEIINKVELYNQITISKNITFNSMVMQGTTTDRRMTVNVSGGGFILSNCAQVNLGSLAGHLSFEQQSTTTETSLFTIKDESSLTITGGEFKNITTTANGGVFNVEEGGTLTIKSGIFENNSAANGGVIYNSGTLNISGGNFEDNSATENGGAIYNNGTFNLSKSPYINSDIYLAEDKFINFDGQVSFVSLNIKVDSAVLNRQVVKSSDAQSENLLSKIVVSDMGDLALVQTGKNYSLGYYAVLDTQDGQIENDGDWKWIGENFQKGFTSEETIGDLPVPARQGYMFAGWYTEKEGGVQVFSETPISGGATYYAKWLDPKGPNIKLEINGTTTYYETLEEAFTEANEVESDAIFKITILEDINVSGKSTVSSDKNIILTSAKIVTVKRASGIETNSLISNSGNLTISGLIIFDGQKGILSSENLATTGGAIYNAATLNISGNVQFNENTVTGTGTDGGGAIYNDGANAEITISDNVKFNNNTAFQGGAIRNYGGTLKIDDNVKFNNNTATYGGAIRNSGPLNISGDVQFNNNTATYGGAIRNDGTLIISKDVIFQGNTAGNSGGAIRNYGTLNISGDVQFNGNTSDSGGAIYNTGTLNISDNVQFNNNKATGNWGYGGAIRNDGTLNISGNVQFNNNTATGTNSQGGAISNNIPNFSTGTLKVTISDFVQFYKNTAYQGGAISNYIPNNSDGTINVTISDFVQFYKNTATTNGGAIYSDNRSTGTLKVTISDFVQFYKNTATTNGGAIYTYTTNSSLTISGNVIFDGNTASQGGAIYNTGTSAEPLTISGYVKFNNNKATDSGGAIYNGGTLLQISGNLTFSGNKVGTTGSDIYLTDGKIVNVVGELTVANPILITSEKNEPNTIIATYTEGVTQNSNHFEMTTGEVLISSGQNIVITNLEGLVAKLEYNGITTYHGTLNNAFAAVTTNDEATITVLKNTSVSSGIIIDSKNITLTSEKAVTISRAAEIGTSSLIRNNNGKLTITGKITFDGQKDNLEPEDLAIQGGAISNTGTSAELTISGDVQFNNNTATHSGGAIYSSGTLDISDNVIFEGNTAGNYGGAISNTGTSAELTISGNVIFKGNEATNRGGAIYNSPVANSTATLNISGDVQFNNNKSTVNVNEGWGGAIFNSGELEISRNVKFNNNIANSGGAIYNNGTLEISDDVQFNNNTATGTFGNGGAITNTGSLTISGNVQFNNNKATGNQAFGGAIWNRETSSSLTINGDTTGNGVQFNNNEAKNGGAIFNSGPTLDISGNVQFNNNKATGEYGQGGAIANAGTLNISGNVIFKENTAVNSGGAIRNTGALEIIGNVQFIDNTPEDTP